MFAKTIGAGISGLNGVMISVEVDISNGIPGLDIVGLPDASVRESKERVKAAIRNAGFEFPCRKIIVNLAPADLKKDGSGLDLPIAIGILAATGQVNHCDLNRIVLVGELSLDAQVRRIAGAKITVVPILRAGLGMLDGVLDMMPSAKVSVVGIARDEETLQPVPYFEKFVGQLDARMALIIDPMLATGGSMVATVDMLKRKGCTHVRALVLVAAPEGIALMNDRHPDVDIYTASIDSPLNEHGYIIPGLGDAGDKIFGTRHN